MFSTSETWGEESMVAIWQCASQSAQRELELYTWGLSCQESLRPPEGQYACRVVYKKDGGSEVLWQARNDPEFCEPKARALVARLQQAGFECAVTEHASRCEEAPQTAVTGRDDAEPARASEAVAASEPAGASEAAVASEPAVTAPATPVEKDEEETAAELRRLLEKYYEDNYLDAMIAAIPAGFDAQSDMDVVSSRAGKNLHVGPPDHFIKTMPDGSYVLVNTLLLEREAASSFVNFGFQVRDQRYLFLGYAVAESVAASQVLDADTDKIVLSVTSVATESCNSTRRTRTVRWGSDLSGQDRAGQSEVMGQVTIGGCEEANQESSEP
jgi:hypothetical protein